LQLGITHIARDTPLPPLRHTRSPVRRCSRCAGEQHASDKLPRQQSGVIPQHYGHRSVVLKGRWWCVDTDHTANHPRSGVADAVVSRPLEAQLKVCMASVRASKHHHRMLCLPGQIVRLLLLRERLPLAACASPCRALARSRLRHAAHAAWLPLVDAVHQPGPPLHPCSWPPRRVPQAPTTPRHARTHPPHGGSRDRDNGPQRAQQPA
jgi:hypothetical protein